eukprot:COSAG05_NODE_2902_length_2524_cov_18.184903_3_plen_74_part_00
MLPVLGLAPPESPGSWCPGWWGEGGVGDIPPMLMVCGLRPGEPARAHHRKHARARIQKRLITTAHPNQYHNLI